MPTEPPIRQSEPDSSPPDHDATTTGTAPDPPEAARQGSWIEERAAQWANARTRARARRSIGG